MGRTAGASGRISASQRIVYGKIGRANDGHAVSIYGRTCVHPRLHGVAQLYFGGLGNRESLFSASHGAGRALSRGDAVKVDDAKFREFLAQFRVINPIDPKRADLRGRSDILKKWEEELKKEAPYAYKDITPVIQSHVDHGMATIVAEVAPIATVKG